MLLAKSIDLEEIEEDIGPERLALLEAEAASRGREQYGAQVIQGTAALLTETGEAVRLKSYNE